MFYLKTLLLEAVILEPNFQIYKVDLSESRIIQLLQKGEAAAFEQVFKNHFKNLHGYAYTILKDEIAAEEMVQNVFCKIWEKKDLLNAETSIKAYLYRAVHNESLNYLKHQKVKAAYQMYAVQHMDTNESNASRKLMLWELEHKLYNALNELPQQCRTIFQMSRFQDMKYQEIANELNLSVKTVENQMGKALKILRTKLVDFLPILLLLFNL